MTILLHFPLSVVTPYCVLLQTSIFVGSDKCFRFVDLNNNNLPIALLFAVYMLYLVDRNCKTNKKQAICLKVGRAQYSRPS